MIDQYLKPNVKQGAIYYGIVAIVLGIVSLIPVLNCIALPVTCLVALLLPFAIGWLVAQWGTSSTMAMVKTPLAVQSTSPYATPAVDGAVAAGTAAAGLAIGGAFGIVGVIFEVIIAAIAGAIGGVLYVVFNQRKATTA
jgi:hypothetical protein